MAENPLHLIMNPRSIATVGAGNNPFKMGTIQALSIIKDGWRGRFYPVHPREETVLGCRAYRRAADLPEAPDLVMLVVPPAEVPALLNQFGRLGTRRAVIISAGFKEAGEVGVALEKEAREIAARHGIRFLGPNCMGILNTAASLNLTVLPHSDRPGFLGLASQSGTYVTQTLPYLKQRGIRLSKAISVGNEADIDIVEALEFLGEDPDTRAISLYIEGLRRVGPFLEAARRITPRKPVVAQYVGGSAAGARAGLSHTGAVAGPDALYEGLFRQAGILRVNSVEELYAVGWALAVLPPLCGNRIAVLTNSGGPGSAMANALNSAGLEVPLFSARLQQQIRQHILPYAACGNPVDLTFHLDSRVLTYTLPEIIAGSGEVDGMVLHGAMSSGFMEEVYPHLEGLLGGLSREEFLEQSAVDAAPAAGLSRRFNLPLVVSSFFDRDNYTAAYREAEVPVVDSPEKAARAMDYLNRYRLVRERGESPAPVLPGAAAAGAAAIVAAASREGFRSLDEFRSKRILAAYGIPVSEDRLVSGAEEAAAAAVEIGFPVAVKACSPDLPHKTEKGLVHLDLGSAEEVRRACRAVTRAAGGAVPVLVSRMVAGKRELAAGVTRYPGFGPVVAFGWGGVCTEALGDTAFRVAPLSLPEARELIGETRVSRLLGPFRGAPAADLDALALLLQRLSILAMLHPEISEIDLNPIIICGSAPVAVDALVVLHGGT